MSSVKLGLDHAQLRWLACAVENSRKQLDSALKSGLSAGKKRALVQGYWYWIDAQFSRFFLALPASVVPDNNTYRIECGSSRIKIPVKKAQSDMIKLHLARERIVASLTDTSSSNSDVIDRFRKDYRKAIRIWTATMAKFPKGALPDGNETNKP